MSTIRIVEESSTTGRLPSDVYRTCPKGVSFATQDGIIVYTHAAHDRMFGYPSGELLGPHVSVQSAYPEETNCRIVGEVIRALRAHGFRRGKWLTQKGWIHVH